jgi:hypothetical protein
LPNEDNPRAESKPAGDNEQAHQTKVVSVAARLSRRGTAVGVGAAIYAANTRHNDAPRTAKGKFEYAQDGITSLYAKEVPERPNLSKLTREIDVWLRDKAGTDRTGLVHEFVAKHDKPNKKYIIDRATVRKAWRTLREKLYAHKKQPGILERGISALCNFADQLETIDIPQMDDEQRADAVRRLLEAEREIRKFRHRVDSELKQQSK